MQYSEGNGLNFLRPAGFMRVFFKKMGIENLRFKPAYNPYTEVRTHIVFAPFPFKRAGRA